MHHIKVKCTDKVANLANLISCGLLLLVAGLRLKHYIYIEFDLFYFVELLYLVSFTIIVFFAEILYLRPESATSLKVRTYFNFLNSLVGRGLFLIFLALIVASKTHQGEIVFSILIIGIGIIDIILGWNDSN